VFSSEVEAMFREMNDEMNDEIKRSAGDRWGLAISWWINLESYDLSSLNDPPKRINGVFDDDSLEAVQPLLGNLQG
jgi:hypothetical protein